MEQRVTCQWMQILEIYTKHAVYFSLRSVEKCFWNLFISWIHATLHLTHLSFALPPIITRLFPAMTKKAQHKITAQNFQTFRNTTSKNTVKPIFLSAAKKGAAVWGTSFTLSSFKSQLVRLLWNSTHTKHDHLTHRLLLPVSNQNPNINMVPVAYTVFNKSDHTAPHH